MAALVSYAGTTLAAVPADIAGWAESNLRLSDIADMARLKWPGPGRELWSWPVHPPQDLRLRLGVLCWPAGASRCGYYYGLCSSDQLKAIRKKVYGLGGKQYLPQPFVLGDGNTGHSLTTSLYMLPPRPLSQLGKKLVAPEQDLYVLPLVDARYFWPEAAADIAVVSGVTTWTQLFTAVASTLSISLSPTINGAYLKPANVLASQYQSVPALLDAAAYNIGLRFVRQLDGTCAVQTPAQALASQNAQLTKWSKTAGGLFDVKCDLPDLPPAEVLISFPTLPIDGTVYASIAATGSNRAGTKSFRDVASASAANHAELDTLTAQFASDWASWQKGVQATAYAGIVPYASEGLSDRIEWTAREGCVETLVVRPALADPVETLCHCSSAVPGEIEPDEPPMLYNRLVTSVCHTPLTTSALAGSTTSLSSSTWTDLAGATISFTLDAAATTVTLTGFFFVAFPVASVAANTFTARLTLTDPFGAPTTMAQTGPIGSTAESDLAASFPWVLAALGPGAWTVQLQGQRTTGSDTITVGTQTTLLVHGDTTLKVNTSTVGIPGGTASPATCEFNPNDCLCPGASGAPGPITNDCCPDGAPETIYAQITDDSGVTVFPLTYVSALNEWVGEWPGDASCAAAGVQIACVGGVFVLIGPEGSISASSQSCDPSLFIQFDNIQDAIPCTGGPPIIIVGDPPVSTACCGDTTVPASLVLSVNITTGTCTACAGAFSVTLTYNPTLTGGPMGGNVGGWASSPASLCGATVKAIVWCDSLTSLWYGGFINLTPGCQAPFMTEQAATATCSPFSLVFDPFSAPELGGFFDTAHTGSAGCTGTIGISVAPGGGGGGGGPIAGVALGDVSGGTVVRSDLFLTPSTTPPVGSMLVAGVLCLGPIPDSVTYGGVPMTLAGTAGINAVYTLPITAGMSGDIIATFHTPVFCQMSAVAVENLPLNEVDTTAINVGTWTSFHSVGTLPNVSLTPSVANTYLYALFCEADQTGGASGNLTLGTWASPFTTGAQDVLANIGGDAWGMTEGYDIPGAAGTYTASLTGTAGNPTTDLVNWYAVGVVLK